MKCMVSGTKINVEKLCINDYFIVIVLSDDGWNMY